MIEEIIEYIASFQTDFKTGIRGATEQEIGELETIIGKSIPNEYREYLAFMGHNNSDFSLWYPYEKSNISSIVQCYQDIYEENYTPPDDCILICDNIYPSQMLGLRKSDNKPESVWLLEDGDYYLEICAKSFEALLWRRAFILYALKGFKHRRYWRLPKSKTPHKSVLLKEKLIQLGIEFLWFSDEVAQCAQGAEIKVLIRSTPYHTDHIYLRIDSDELVSTLDSYLSQELNATRNDENKYMEK